MQVCSSVCVPDAVEWRLLEGISNELSNVSVWENGEGGI